MICDYCGEEGATSRTIGRIMPGWNGNSSTWYSSYNVCKKKKCHDAFVREAS